MSQHILRDHLNRRNGLTIFESLAGLVLVALGIVGGLWWMGTDPTQLIELVQPAVAGDPKSHQAVQDSASAAAPSNSDAKTSIEPTQLTTTPGHDGNSHATKSAQPAVDAKMRTGKRTLNYWNALNDIMAKEERMRAVPAGGLTAENAADYLRRRGEAGDFAAEQIHGLDSAGVDPEAVALAGNIAAWYQQGNSLNDRASFLLNKAAPETRRGASGQSWSRAEKDHHRSVGAINRRGDELRRQLSAKYGLPFPDLR